MLAGTIRLLPYEDFRAQFSQTVFIDVFTVTIPYLTLLLVYMNAQDELGNIPLVGLIVHLTNLVFTIKHICVAQTDEIYGCTLLDPRTCFGVRKACSCFSCTSQDDVENTDSPTLGDRDSMQQTVFDQFSKRNVSQVSTIGASNFMRSTANVTRNRTGMLTTEKTSGGNTDRAIRLNVESTGSLPDLNIFREDLASQHMKITTLLYTLEWDFVNLAVYFRVIRLSKLSSIFLLVWTALVLVLAWVFKEKLMQTDEESLPNL